MAPMNPLCQRMIEDMTLRNLRRRPSNHTLGCGTVK
jgi:hypothetical protein